MKTQPIKYSEVKTGDKIFYKPNDHERRKLNFSEIEIVESAETFISKGNGLLVKIMFVSGHGTLGFPNIELNKILED